VRPLRWFDLWVGSRRVEVCFSTPKHCVALRAAKRPLFGVCLYDEERIILNALAPKIDFAETLIHELLHLALEDYGDLPSDQEEKLVEYTDGRLTSLLRQCKWEMPPLPRGLEALRSRKQ
jgi:hypothetical protein